LKKIDDINHLYENMVTTLHSKMQSFYSSPVISTFNKGCLIRILTWEYPQAAVELKL